LREQLAQHLRSS